jgi:hypothetical protein
MITDVPTPEQFEQAAADLLNLAWTAAADLTHGLNLVKAALEDEVEREVSDEYWNAAQRPLGNALALVQQAMEFLLKARIAAISPYLLLNSDPRDWPKGCERNDTSFADFKTIDANELIRAHNAVAPSRLDDSFRTFFEELRRLRNTTTHSIARDRRFTEEQVYLSVLKIVAYLMKPKRWIDIRRDYLERDPIAVLHSTDFSPARLAQDITAAINLLSPADAWEHFRFDKKAHAYHCPWCIRRCAEGQVGIGESEPALAQLVEKSPYCIRARCALCDREIEVIRQPCAHDHCPGNVIELYTRVCMTCNCYQPDHHRDADFDC